MPYVGLGGPRTHVQKKNQSLNDTCLCSSFSAFYFENFENDLTLLQFITSIDRYIRTAISAITNVEHKLFWKINGKGIFPLILLQFSCNLLTGQPNITIRFPGMALNPTNTYWQDCVPSKNGF